MFQTKRLIIRPTSVKDSFFMYQLMNTDSWLEYIGDRNIRSESDAKDYILKSIISQYERLGYSSYTLIDKVNNEKIGVCGLYDRASVEGIDLGFALLSNYERLGLAYEAAARLIMAAREDFNLSELSAITLMENARSKALLKRLGFVFIESMLVNDEKLELWKMKL